MALLGKKYGTFGEKVWHFLGERTSFAGSENVIQCFLTEWGRFLNRFLRAMPPSFLVLGDNCCTFNYVESTFARQYKEKQVFLWYYARLSVPLHKVIEI